MSQATGNHGVSTADPRGQRRLGSRADGKDASGHRNDREAGGRKEHAKRGPASTGQAGRPSAPLLLGGLGLRRGMPRRRDSWRDQQSMIDAG
jgi:hypothetical protein